MYAEVPETICCICYECKGPQYCDAHTTRISLWPGSRKHSELPQGHRPQRGWLACRIRKHEANLLTLSTGALKDIIDASSTTDYAAERDGVAVKPSLYAHSELVKVDGTPTLSIKLLLRKYCPVEGVVPPPLVLKVL